MAHEIKLKDFYSCVILRTLGFQIDRIDRYSNDVAVFVFKDPDKNATQALQDYWDRKLKVTARDLIDAIHEVKSRIYEKV